MYADHTFTINMLWDTDPAATLNPADEMQPSKIVSRTIAFQLNPYMIPGGPTVLFWVANVTLKDAEYRSGLRDIFKDAVKQYGNDAERRYGEPRVRRVMFSDEYRALIKSIHDQATGELTEDTTLIATSSYELFNATPHVYKLESRKLTFVLWVVDEGFHRTESLEQLQAKIHQHFITGHNRDSQVINRVLTTDEYKEFQKQLLYVLDTHLLTGMSY